MKLQSLQIKNYRNFDDSGVIPFHELTVFVGENGSGKTSTLDSMVLLIDYGRSKPIQEDFIDSALPVEIEGVFEIPPSEEERPIDKFCIGETLTIKYAFTLQSATAEYSIKCNKYIDDRFNTYKALRADVLKV